MPQRVSGRGNAREGDELPPHVARAWDAAIRSAFDDDRLARYAPVPAPVVEGIERLWAEGVPLREIARRLRQRGKPAPVPEGWSPIEVRLVLVLAADPDLRARLVAPRGQSSPSVAQRRTAERAGSREG